jgi:hypothetical protein
VVRVRWLKTTRDSRCLRQRNELPQVFLRRIPIGEILSRTQRRLADDSWRTAGVQLIPPPGETGANLAADELTEEQRRALENSVAIGARRRGRPELSDELLIDVAEAYIWEAGRGRGALKRMSEIFDRPEATIRDWITLARRRGYLAPTKAGRRGAAPHLSSFPACGPLWWWWWWWICCGVGADSSAKPICRPPWPMPLWFAGK